MKMVSKLQCEVDGIQIGYFDEETEEWISLEDDDSEEQIKRLLARPDAQELILRGILAFAVELRQAINKDNLDLYERTEDRD